MFLASTLAILALTTPPARPHHIPARKLNDIATLLAHDEGWPLGSPDYTLDRMTPDVDDGFDSIGLYRKAHLLRMYSVDRTTGQIVDFLRGCQIFEFPDTRDLQAGIRQGRPTLTPQQLAKKAGCPQLTVVNTRWVP